MCMTFNSFYREWTYYPTLHQIARYIHGQYNRYSENESCENLWLLLLQKLPHELKTHQPIWPLNTKSWPRLQQPAHHGTPFILRSSWKAGPDLPFFWLLLKWTAADCHPNSIEEKDLPNNHYPLDQKMRLILYILTNWEMEGNWWDLEIHPLKISIL
jgi:hypothetical protein